MSTYINLKSDESKIKTFFTGHFSEIIQWGAVGVPAFLCFHDHPFVALGSGGAFLVGKFLKELETKL